MAEQPFVIPLSGTLADSGTLTLSYQVPTNQELMINSMIHTSTGTFSITDIADSEGTRYTNATQSNAIPSSLLLDGADSNNGLNPFKESLVLKGARTISISLLDTSGGANTVNIALNCILKKP